MLLNWNIDVLQQLFGKELIIRILNITIQPQVQEDLPDLCSPLSGKTITALTYNQQFPLQPDVFGWIRKLQLHPREQIFWWRLLRNAIPTNEWLCFRGLADSSFCPWGCQVVENRFHIIADCIKIREVFNILRKWGFAVAIFTTWEEAIMCLGSCSSSHCALARVMTGAIYQCWRSRNAMKNGRSYGTSTSMAAAALQNLTATFSFSVREQWGSNQPLGLFPVFSKWFPPPPTGWIKVNIDGAWQSSNVAGIGIVVRDENGRLLKAFGQSFQHWDCATVELLAAIAVKGLIEDWMLEAKGVIIEGDSSNVIKLLQNCSSRTASDPIMQDAPDIGFLQQFRQVIFHLTRRTANRAADFCSQVTLTHSIDFVSHNAIHVAHFEQFFAEFSLATSIDRAHVFSLFQILVEDLASLTV